jgi:hypothetical protein
MLTGVGVLALVGTISDERVRIRRVGPFCSWCFESWVWFAVCKRTE